MEIKINSITGRQKLIIEKGLLDYRYIMENRKKDDADFRAVYYDFYLKARWAVMSKEENKDAYFNVLRELSPSSDLTDVLDALKKKMKIEDYEFSLGTKLLHSVNGQTPIYDSKVRKYLSEEENVDFWWLRANKKRKEIEKIKIIEHDWKLLKNWYSEFLRSARGKEWIEWFDENFPGYSDIADVKKVDFIIFALN